MCNPTRRPTDGTVPIRFGTYNIRKGQKGGLKAALRGMSQANMDLGILQETKLTDGVYTRVSASYKVIATDAPSQHRGGVALFCRLTPHFVVEAVERCGPNVMVFQVTTGERRWHIVGAYVAPRGRSYHGDGDRGDRKKAAGSGLDGGGVFQCGHPSAGGKEGGEYCDGPGDGGS